jgi:3-phosphoshikimate 1-carboxyvinyltransferase
VTANAVPQGLRAVPGGGLRGDFVAPGDKSISHRALILGALAQGETRVEGLLESADVLATAAALRAFGAACERQGAGVWLVKGAAWRSPKGPIDCGNSGTAARLLMGAAAGFPIETLFGGDESLRRRPMGRVTAPLAGMGARFDGAATLPIQMRGGALHGIAHRNEPASAQVKSALLLAGLRANGPVELVERAPSRDHTEIMLRAFGCDVESRGFEGGVMVSLGARRDLVGTGVQVPGDPSSAAFPVVAALVTPGSDVIVRNVLLNPLRSGLLDTLIEMGAEIQVSNRRWLGGELVGDLRARSSRLRGVEVPAERAPSMIDEYPVLAVAAACASGTTFMRGLDELRHKESDRLDGMARGLAACGVEAAAEGESLAIRPAGRPPGGASVETRGDHRIAMSFLVLGLAAQRPVTVDRADMIATSFPGFAAMMRSLGAQLEEV